ncbi:MAG: hypothetical protein IK149_01745 [Oscillospiraceae bacterium]|nr:hypothetical protein [Oscillospiraceae bacterium]
MTIGEVIGRVDTLSPNQYSNEMKIRWLTNLDGRIYEEIIKTHANPLRDSFETYAGSSAELIVPDPYAEDLYVFYLQAMIAAQNAEDSKYEQMRVLYNEALTAFQSWYNRNHAPRGLPRFRF